MKMACLQPRGQQLQRADGRRGRHAAKGARNEGGGGRRFVCMSHITKTKRTCCALMSV